MNNYYKILEVDRDASSEVIEKAYKTLVKKYHPDLNTGEDVSLSETKIKKINEAYDVLSDETKRRQYDSEFKEQYISIEEYNSIIKENNLLKNEINNLKNNINNYSNNFQQNNNSQRNNYYVQNNYSSNNNSQKNNYYTQNNYSSNNNSGEKYTRKINPEYNEPYWQTPNIKSLLKSILILFVCLLIIFLFFQIPFIKNLFANIFNDNFLTVIVILLFVYFYFFRHK